MHIHFQTMPSDDSVNIRIKEETWRELHSRKGPGDSFDDVIQRILDEHDSLEEALNELESNEGNGRVTPAD